MTISRDIDYAATAVKTAILEKFGRQTDLSDLEVRALESTISVSHAGQTADGTRDNLLAALRRSADFESLWRELAPKKTRK